MLTRTVSATLIAVFATLASAAALCLLPCELTPSVPVTATAAAGAHHCSEPPAPLQGGTTLNGITPSCADQHAWEGPAVDRTASRASAPAIPARAMPPVVVQVDAETAGTSAGHLLPPASPPLTSAPLRI